MSRAEDRKFLISEINQCTGVSPSKTLHVVAQIENLCRAVLLIEGETPDLRDRFAMSALQGMLAGRDAINADAETIGGWARLAYQYADAMLKAREAE